MNAPTADRARNVATAMAAVTAAHARTAVQSALKVLQKTLKRTLHPTYQTAQPRHAATTVKAVVVVVVADVGAETNGVHARMLQKVMDRKPNSVLRIHLPVR